MKESRLVLAWEPEWGVGSVAGGRREETSGGDQRAHYGFTAIYTSDL